MYGEKWLRKGAVPMALGLVVIGDVALFFGGLDAFLGVSVILLFAANAAFCGVLAVTAFDKVFGKKTEAA